MPKYTLSPWYMVLRYLHAGSMPEVHGVYATSAHAHKDAYRLKSAHSGERVTILQDGYESEVSL